MQAYRKDTVGKEPVRHRIRRRLLEEREIEVPRDLVARTAHLAEFQQNAAPAGDTESMEVASVHGAAGERDKDATEGSHTLGKRQSATTEVIREAEMDVTAVPTDETLPSLIDAIVALLSRHPGGQWSGKCGDLLGELTRNGRATADGKWPRTPQQLGTALRRHRDDLDRLDIGLSFRREGKSSTRVVTLSRPAELPK